MRRWLLPLLLVASVGLNAGLLLHRFLAPRGLRAGITPSPGWHAGPMRHHLGLNAAQARQLDDWHREVLAGIRPLQERLAGKRRELVALLKESPADPARFDAVIDEIAGLQAAVEKVFARHSLKVRGALSPEQLRKYEGCLERGLCPATMGGSRCPSAADAGGERPACAPGERETSR
ncbi:MAG TPA: periplasmic heavy metal sensor [Candidatus Aminicenantes bacterium]|nr:periplasmic heavy metal sensor [Candidatus Aminicenantes bacterium]